VQRIAVEPTPAQITAPTPEPILTETFEDLWRAVDEHYVYADFGGVDWENVRLETLPKVQSAASDEEFAGLMKAMVEALPEGTAIYETERLEAEQQQQQLRGHRGVRGLPSFTRAAGDLALDRARLAG
jgi:hypothetical protein